MLLGAYLRSLTNSRAMDVAVVDGSGNQITNFSSSVTPPANAAITTVAAGTTSQLLLPANANRRRVVIHNDGNGTIFVAFAASATLTAFTYEIGAHNTHDGPLHDYTGDISVIRQSGTSDVRVTEITT